MFLKQLAFDPLHAVTLLDWLATPAQRLAEVTTGAVFHDGPGDLTRARARLAWYPRDVWLYLLACQWQRIGQEEAFPGRCAEAGDDLGAAVVTARLARDLRRLWLLMHRRYPPYSKWLGTVFARLPQTAGLATALAAAISATDSRTREQQLGKAYETVATRHNKLGLTPPRPGEQNPEGMTMRTFTSESPAVPPAVQGKAPPEASPPAPAPPAERLAYSVDEAAQLTGLSRDLLYDEMRRGNLRYRKVGRRRLITRRDLEEFLGLPITPLSAD